jgi:hypothetical protein
MGDPTAGPLAFLTTRAGGRIRRPEKISAACRLFCGGADVIMGRVTLRARA